MVEEEVRPSPRYSVGDIVRVVDEPYESCPFDWIESMDDYCGCTATIVDVQWNRAFRTWAYSIDIDESGCSWCEDCFATDYNEDIEESDINFNELFA